MTGFSLDVAATTAARERAAALADSATVATIFERARSGAHVSDEDIVALLLTSRVTTDELSTVARRIRSEAGRHLETFSPLYMTNECDAECLMCGMRRANDDLARETADAATVDAQLALLTHRGVRGVALLTGEYRHGAMRRTMIGRTNTALRAALAHGFRHILINIGALDADEYPLLLAGIPRDAGGRVVPQVTMCTFQEAYRPEAYARFMGTTAENPRSDYARRLQNFDRAAAAGMWSVNPGILLGLNDDLGWEVLALLAHVRHLAAQGLRVYISIPRLRRASGTAYPAGISDDQLARIVAVLAIGVPDALVVISTRESPPVQRRLLPMIGVLTPGSPGVAPYTADGARFDLDASQFEVLDHRPIEAILGEYIAEGATFDCFESRARV